MSIKSHPKGLYVLFFTEAWERFSYYGMRALLVLYLVKHINMARHEALEIYALYTGLVYFTPMIGGYLADKYLGARKAIIIGGLVMALGHLAMAFESLLYTALGLLIVGNGFFKPNISTIVGGLYEEHDPRRDGGFTIFYMGINLGAFFSPLVCGTLGETIGWHWGFSAAGIGMVAGLLVFLLGQKILGPKGFPPHSTREYLTAKDYFDVLVYTVASVAFVFGFLKFWEFFGPRWKEFTFASKTMFSVLSIAAVLAVGKLFAKKNRAVPGALYKNGAEETGDAPLSWEEWQRIIVICVISIFVIFFWMGFEQAGGTLTLFADQQTDRHFMGFEIPASYFQSINPLAIMLMAPFFSILWYSLDDSKYALSTPAKMAIGMITLGLGFIVMYFGQSLAFSGDSNKLTSVALTNGFQVFPGTVYIREFGKVGPLWLAMVYLIHTIGELCLSPIGLSMVTKLSPERFVSLMMGIWFVSSALSNYLAGRLEEILTVYQFNIYIFLIMSSIGAGLLLLALTPMLNKWSHGKA
ncbi:MAG: hypothetical protein A2008_00950 [Candidatus Wallbacteria bacterium GWC2_49_35]|uniref:Peptide ABC transporter n=1 Tax=Candidatus Wallbacteria bacterium GWC2_49_35 TaxID=1817813 RepID=A0A1F7WVB4_9BACT|nr:MAG: hypothetical protein A2008_00950 [Candidatus Wallbacteria bacterium GWC2_49_35]